MLQTSRTGSPFWLGLWALTLALGWLIPNHAPPWGAFHHDAWIALGVLVIALVVFLRGAVSTTAWTPPVVVSLALAVAPWAQYVSGQIVFAGVAWMPSLYLLGLAFALRVGTVWEHATPGEPARVLGGAILFAALMSTGLALAQWLQFDLDIWMVNAGTARPFANIGQPNQLGTFLSWGLIALAWLWAKRHVGLATWLLSSAFLLMGMALTGSRTSWLILGMLVVMLAWWRHHFPRRQLLVGGLLLLAWFVFCSLAIPKLTALAQVASTAGAEPQLMQLRMATDIRPMVWGAYIDAALRSPWWGYGWTQAQLGQMAVLLDYPDWQILFSHTHNLFLDLVLWMGLPLGLAVSAFLLWRFWRLFTSVKTLDQALLFCMLLAVAIHAMLELPLHYAYMLLPAGLIWGILEASQPGWSWPRLGRRAHLGAWLVSAALLACVLRDYLNVQTSYQWLQFEWARLATQKTAPEPQVVMLTQWPAFVRLSHRELRDPVTPDELREMQNLAHLYPSAGFLMQLASAQALNGQPDAAQVSLRQACQMHGPAQCAAIRQNWQLAARHQPALSRVTLPE